MTENKQVECPYCGIASEVSTLIRRSFLSMSFTREINFHGDSIECQVLRCANANCGQSSLWISYSNDKGAKHKVRLVPKSSAKSFPKYIPEGLREDYEESCLILGDSPKASAALARRCLQGMIHDFWKVKKNNLYKEIEAIKTKVEPSTYKALIGLKDTGNKAVHPDKISDISEGDAQRLVHMIEFLFEKWYVAKHTDKELISSVSKLARNKPGKDPTNNTHPNHLKSPHVENT